MCAGERPVRRLDRDRVGDARPDHTAWPVLICVLEPFRVLQLAGEALRSRVKSLHTLLGAGLGGAAPVLQVDGGLRLSAAAGVSDERGEKMVDTTTTPLARYAVGRALRSPDGPLQSGRDGPLPLIIGVTGHRDLRAQDLLILEGKVAGIFNDLRQRYRHTPLVLLSSLAEGADRLVARVALALGVHLIVPLPMPRAIYEQDFAHGASRTEFDDLLRRADCWFALPADEDAVRRPGEARNQQYARLGAYIASHSQILIALWDGTDTQRTGGASQVVHFQLTGVPEPYAPPRCPLDAVESGPVYHIVTPRFSNPRPAGAPFEQRTLLPDVRDDTLPWTGSGNPWQDEDRATWGGTPDRAQVEAEFDRIFARLDTFNADAARLGQRRVDAQQRKKPLLPDLDVATPSVTLRQALEAFAVADALAIDYRAQTTHTLRILLWLVFFAVACFAIFAHFEAPSWVASLSVFLWLLALLRYWWARRADIQNKYLDYRALAEGLRVQCFWHVAGVPDSAADHYLRKQKGELAWIRNGVRTVNVPRGGGECAWPTDEQGPPAYDLALQHWVKQQSAWFQTATNTNRDKMKWKELGVRFLFVTGLLLSVLLVFLTTWGHALEGRNALRDWLILLTTLALLGAGLSEYNRDKMAYSDQAKQYQRMRDVFMRASRELTLMLQRGQIAHAGQLIRDLGQEALAENGDWVVLHRGRPLDIPKGG